MLFLLLGLPILSACIEDDDVARRLDQDGDGFDDSRSGGTDCDDDAPMVNPDAVERCDSVDNDCDGTVDEEPVDGVYYFLDVDGDGWGSAPGTACEAPDGGVTMGGDCNDQADSVHPSADEVCDGIDQDCDAEIDEDLPQVESYADS